MKPKRSKPYWNVQDENVFRVHPNHKSMGILSLFSILIGVPLICLAVVGPEIVSQILIGAAILIFIVVKVLSKNK